MPDGVIRYFGFDNKKGGECDTILEDFVWLEDKISDVQKSFFLNDDEDEEWTIM